METQGKEKQELAEESWEETVRRARQLVKNNGEILFRSGRFFMFREDEEKHGQAMAEAVMADDMPKFLSIMKGNYFIDEGILLTYCLYRRAKKCALALLSIERNLYKHQRDELSDDHVNLAVQYFCDPEILQGILEQAEMKADICRNGLLPIHFALTNLRELKHVAHWTLGDSIIKLIILLCLPDSKSILDCVRLLAERMKGVEDLAFYCAMDRGLIELAALLFVAREMVMAPMSGDLERSPEDWYYSGYADSESDSYKEREATVVELKLDGRYVYDELPIGYTIVHRLLLELGILAGEGIALEKTTHTDPEFNRFCEKSRLALWDAYQLIHIFKRAGEALGAYVRSDQSSLSTEQIIKEVAELLMEAGYNLTYKDIDLRDAVSSLDVELIWKQLESMEVISTKEETQKPEEWISLPAEFSMVNGSLSQVYHNRKLLLKESPSFMENNSPCGMTFGAFDLRRKFHTSRAASANCFLNTKQAPVTKFAKVLMEQPVVKNSSGNQLQILVASLKRGITHHI